MEGIYAFLNSKPGNNLISITSCTVTGTSLSNYLKGRKGRIIFFCFYSLSDNPFSFKQGFCIAFNSGDLMPDNLFVLVGIDREGGKIEAKQITIK